MRVELKAALAAFVTGAVLVALQGPAVAAEVVVPPSAGDQATEGIDEPTLANELVILNNNGKKFALLNPGLGVPLLAGGLDLYLQGSPSAGPVTKYGGHAIGAYVEARYGDSISLRTGKIADSYIRPGGGGTGSNSVLSTTTPWPLYAWVTGLWSVANGHDQNTNRRALASTEIAELDMPGLGAQGIHSSVEARRSSDGTCRAITDIRFAKIGVNGSEFTEPDIAPNTTYQVPGLGQVILNEQKMTNLPGVKCQVRLNAIHIKLDTAQLGLPVGADVYIGSSEGIVYG